MSILKKLGAVALGTASATGWLATNTVKALFEEAGDKLGKNSVTTSKGETYTGEDYKNVAEKIDDSAFAKGFKKSIELWKDED